MGYEDNIADAIWILFCAGVVIGILMICFSYLADFFIEYNEEKEEKLRANRLAEEKDREIITQAKRHTIDCTEDYVRSLREKKQKLDSDFKVDFDINLSGSIVKTEVVYAE